MGLLLERFVSTEQEDWAAQAEENHWPSHLLTISFLPSSIIYLYTTTSSCLWTIYLGCFCFVFLVERINVPMWITPCHTYTHAWRAPRGDRGLKRLLNAAGSQRQLVLFFYNYLRRRYFIVGWVRCFEGTVTAQWLCVFVDLCCVGQWTCWICKWLLVSYHKRIKWEK